MRSQRVTDGLLGGFTKDGARVRDRRDLGNGENISVVPCARDWRPKEIDAIGEIHNLLPQEVKVEVGSTQVDNKVSLTCSKLVLELLYYGTTRAGIPMSCGNFNCCLNLDKLNPSQLCFWFDKI